MLLRTNNSIFITIGFLLLFISPRSCLRSFPLRKSISLRSRNSYVINTSPIGVIVASFPHDTRVQSRVDDDDDLFADVDSRPMQYVKQTVKNDDVIKHQPITATTSDTTQDCQSLSSVDDEQPLRENNQIKDINSTFPYASIQNNPTSSTYVPLSIEAYRKKLSEFIKFVVDDAFLQDMAPSPGAFDLWADDDDNNNNVATTRSDYKQGGFQAQRASIMHRFALNSLIRSDVQQRNTNESDPSKAESQIRPFPPLYSVAMEAIGQIVNRLKQEKSPLLPLVDAIFKAEGLSPLLKVYTARPNKIPHESTPTPVSASIKETINESSSYPPLIPLPAMRQFEIVALKRKIERSFSLTWTLLIAYRNCKAQNLESDLLYFGETILQHVPVHERHLMFLLFTRGVLSPNYSKVKKLTEGVDAQFATHSPWPSLKASYIKSCAIVSMRHPTNACQLLFPFASLALRNHALWIGSESGASFSASTNTFTPSSSSSSSSSSSTSSSTSDSASIAFTEVDRKLALLLKSCVDLDKLAERNNSLQNVAAEFLTSVRLWICKVMAAHFITGLEASALRESLPAEIRRNTVAMELALTERAFDEGRKIDRLSYMMMVTEIGKHLDIMIEFASLLSSDRYSFDEVESESFMLNLKKFLAVIDAVRILPASHEIRQNLNWRLGLNQFHIADNKFGIHKTGSVSRMGYANNNNKDDDDDDMFWDGSETQGKGSQNSMFPWGAPSWLWKAKKKNKAGGPPLDIDKAKGIIWNSKGRNRVVDSDSLVDGGGESDIWPEDINTSKGQRSGKTEHILSKYYSTISATENLAEDVQRLLCQVLAEILKVDETILLSRPQVAYEIDEVFSTWRRPQLLLEYYYMHSSSPDVQALYRRFLNALFGIKEETFDDIRYRDIGNLRHFEKIPASLVEQWVEGRSSDGTILPGYNDAQTLFMLGEDGNTCMGIRSTEKTYNRALLSILLHGNCRVIGRKDASGRLLERAVVLLLVDSATNAPVLYVCDPHSGTSKTMKSVSSALSQPSTSSHEYPIGSIGSTQSDSNKLGVSNTWDSPSNAGVTTTEFDHFDIEDNEDWDRNEISGERLISLYDDAAELGRLLRLPVIYSSPPPAGHYMMSPTEVPAILMENMVEFYIDPLLGQPSSFLSALGNASVKPNMKNPYHRLVDLEDWTFLAPYVWIDGLKNPIDDEFIPGRFPSVERRSLAELKDKEYLALGVRPAGVIEFMISEGRVMKPLQKATFTKTASVNDISDTGASNAERDKYFSLLESAVGQQQRTSNPQNLGNEVKKNERPASKRGTTTSVQARLAERQKILHERQMNVVVQRGGGSRSSSDADASQTGDDVSNVKSNDSKSVGDGRSHKDNKEEGGEDEEGDYFFSGKD